MRVDVSHLELKDVGVFWISVGIIVLLGTIGGILFKHGTNNLGQITFSRLLELEINLPSLISISLVVMGFLLFFVGGYTLRNHSFAATYLFSPIIFTALVLLALSRFLVGIPLSMMGLGRFTAIITAVGVAATAFASAIVFKEQFSLRVIVGMALAVGAISLLGQEF